MGFQLTVEVPLFLTFFAFLLTDSVNTNLIIYRTCYLILGQDKHNCSLLGSVENATTRELEKLVQPKADVITMVKTIVDSVSAAVLCLFVGSWSDRFGRRPVLLLNLIGYTLMNVVMIVFSAVDTASPWFMMACSVPVIFTGGGSSYLTVLLASLTDKTRENERGFRMGVFEVTMATAVLLGSSSSAYVLNSTGYVTVYCIAAASCLMALIYAAAFIPETLQVVEDSDKLKGFFQVQNVLGLFKTSFKKRPHFHRAIILLVMLALALFFVVVAGDGGVTFLFTREKFHWTLQQFTQYNSISNVMWISSTLFIVYVVHHKLQVKESKLILAGFFSLVAGPLILGFAQKDWLMYAAAAVRTPSGGISPMTRSLLSKLVDPNEAGKIFALFNLIQNLLELGTQVFRGMVGSPVYTTLYNATLNTNPGIYNFLSASIQAVNAACLVVVLVLQRKTLDESYSRLEPEPESSNS